MTAPHRTAVVPGGALGTVRRIVVLVLLFAMVTIAAIGVAGLLGRLLDVARDPVVAGDAPGLARSLAFTFIAGPLAAVLWWFLWRGLRSPGERASVAWGLYLAGMYTVALVTFTTAALVTASGLVEGEWRPEALAAAVAWAAVWAWHRWMWGHPERGSLRLHGGPVVLAWAFGLVLVIGGGVTALTALFDAAVRAVLANPVFGEPWWTSSLQAAIFAVGGALIWWWHWMRDRGRELRTGFSLFAIVAAMGLAVLLAAGGAATMLFVVLRLLVDRSEPLPGVLEPLGSALAAAAVGSVVAVYYRGILRGTPRGAQEAGRLLVSGVGLAGAASGIGVVVNALLAGLGSPLAESDPLLLLLGGISAAAVGGPLWWLAWKPLAPADPAAPGRRVYLVVVFGVAGAVALVTLLVLGYRLFEFALGVTPAPGLLDRIRAPLGLLLATGLVAGYHFAVWLRERPAAPAEGRPPRAIGRIYLVTAASTPLQPAIEAATGVPVTEWHRLDLEDGGPGPDAVLEALADVRAARVLVVTGPAGTVDVIPLD